MSFSREEISPHPINGINSGHRDHPRQNHHHRRYSRKFIIWFGLLSSLGGSSDASSSTKTSKRAPNNNNIIIGPTRKICSRITKSHRSMIEKCYISVKRHEKHRGFYYGLCDDLLRRNDDDDDNHKKRRDGRRRIDDDVLRDTVDSLCGYMAPDDRTTTDDDDTSSYVTPRMPSVLASLRHKRRDDDDDAVVGGGRRRRAGGTNDDDDERRSANATTSPNPRYFAWLPSLPPMTSGGLYHYGISEDMFRDDDEGKKSRPTLDDDASSTADDLQEQVLDDPDKLIEDMTKSLSEFRSMTEELRRSLSAMEKQMSDLAQSLHLQKTLAGMADDEEEDDGSSSTSPTAAESLQRRKRRRYAAVARDVERWARDMFAENENDGWEEVKCSKMLRSKFKNHDNVKCYLKWMPDSRRTTDDDNNDGVPQQQQLFPCIKVYATIDAPFRKVASYLSNPATISEYNDLVADRRDLEIISPRSKICWAASPAILFIKPRDFVTFCHLSVDATDGSQIIVNQALDDHPSLDKTTMNRPAADGGGTPSSDDGTIATRAFALRGANVIKPAKGHEGNRTTFELLAHADPGGNLAPWAMKTAINTLAPIEPFKLFHRIERNANRVPDPPPAATMRSDDEGMEDGSRQGEDGRRDGDEVVVKGGLSQMGYACFWPDD